MSTNFDKRISAFINVENSLEKKDTKNLLLRHDSNKMKNTPIQPQKIELLIPINDQRISFSLSQVLFCHPFLLVGLITDENWKAIPDNKINEILLPFQLYTDASLDTENRMLIPQLAGLFSMKPNDFLIYVKGKQIKTKAIQDNWARIFSKSSLPQAEIDLQLKVFFDRFATRFPDEDWELKSLDDLYSLHVLACSLNMQFFLIFPRIPEKSLSTYSLTIGIENNHKYEIYIVVLSPKHFLIAEPLNYKKVIGRSKEKSDGSSSKNLLKTFETIDQNFALYFNFDKKLFSHEPKIHQIKGKIIEKTDINSPILEIKTKNCVSLKVSVPWFDQENTALLSSFLESVSDEFIPLKKANVESEQSQKTYTIPCKDGYKVMGSDKFFLVSREVKDEGMEKTLDEIGFSKKPQHLDAPCQEVIRKHMIYMENPHQSSMPDNDALRIVIASLPHEQVGDDNKDESDEEPEQESEEKVLFYDQDVSFQQLLKEKQPPSLTPLFLHQKSRITLAQCAQSKYAQDLCTLSVLKYCVGQVDSVRHCSMCECDIDNTVLMLPFEKNPVEDLLFVCHSCHLKNRDRVHIKLMDTNKDDTLLFDVARGCKDLKNPEKYIKRIEKYITIYQSNIDFLREHPIGHLKQMHALIDEAFHTLQGIVLSHKSMSALGPTISLQSMLGLRDNKEVDGFQPVLATNDVPVSSELFTQYLQKQTDIQYISQQYQLVKQPDEIIQELDHCCTSIFDETAAKTSDESPVIEVNGKKQTQLPLFNITSVPDNKNHLMDVRFNFIGKGDQKRIVNKYQYKTHVIRSASHLSLSPESTITTSKEITHIWKYNKNMMLIIAQNEHNDKEENDDLLQYTTVFLYIVPLGNIKLDFCTPLMTFKEAYVNCVDFLQDESTHQLAIYYSNPEHNHFKLIDLHQRRSKCTVIDNVDYLSIKALKYGTNKYLFIAYENDDKIYFQANANGEYYHFRKSIDLNTKFQLVGTPNFSYVVLESGSIIDLEIKDGEEEEDIEEDKNENEEEEESSDLVLPKVSIDSPLITTINNRTQGIVNIIKKFNQNGQFTGQYDFGFYPSSFETPSIDISFGHINDHQTFFNQFGMYPNANSRKKKLYKDSKHLWNIHLTAAEFFPALVAYESHGLMFLVCKNMEQFRDVNPSKYFVSSIRSFYSRTFSKLSLHHIEDVIRTYGYPVSIDTFLGDMSNSNAGEFIDTLFGTRFSSVNINGVWVGVRIIGKIIHLIIYFHGNNTNKMNLLRLAAALRAANTITICSNRVINSFNFIKEYQNSIPKPYFLLQRNLQPRLVVMFFQESKNYVVDFPALSELKRDRVIIGKFCIVDYRPSWNTSTAEDLVTSPKKLKRSEDNEEEEEEEDDNDDDDDDGTGEKDSETIFAESIQSMYHFDTPFDDTPEEKEKHIYRRKPLKPDNGINMAYQIITTYLTLFEFQDLPPKTVLKYCNLTECK